MKHKFFYVKAGIWYRPIIPVTLRYNKREFNYLALLDSGADFNIFHGDIAKILKIDLSKQKSAMEFSGIKQNASGKGYFMSIDVGIENEFFTTTAIFQRIFQIMDMEYWVNKVFLITTKCFLSMPLRKLT